MDELNVVLNNDGTRSRRLGMGIESSGVVVSSTLDDVLLQDSGMESYKWDLSDVSEGLVLSVIQTGNVINFFEFSAGGALSNNKLSEITLDSKTSEAFAFASVNQYLVIATGEEVFRVENVSLEYGVLDLVVDTIELSVRDFFGITDKVGDRFIDRGNDVKYRPTAVELTSEHVYNLHNQGWPIEAVWSFLDGDGEEKFKAIPHKFAGNYLGVYPANADPYTLYVVSDVEESPASVDGFTPDQMETGLEYNAQAPDGNFIIDVFDRSTSREEATLKSGIGFVPVQPLEIPADRSPKKVSTVAEFAGRMFYAGFSSALIGGDDRSPRLGNYVLFSQLINNAVQLGQCYQSASPTNKDDSELVATDGGYIRISGAVGINHLEPLGSSLLVFAENGVWQVLGGSDFGFSADNYQVVKVTERGCVSPRSVINIGEQAVWWADDGIYITEMSDTGMAVAKDLTRASIKSLYDSIPSKTSVFGAYDEFERTLRWVYDGKKELIFKYDTQAWTKFELMSTGQTLRSFVEAPPIDRLVQDDLVLVGSDQVISDTDVVTTPVPNRSASRVELKYLAEQDNQYSFTLYNSTDFMDFNTDDASAYMISSYFTGGSGSAIKQSPYVTFHFNKTELGFDDNFEPINQSSCKVQSRWDFSNSSTSNKFGKEFQAYRHRRHYIPATANDLYDNGYETVVTKNKLRGKGKALSLKLSTEPLKDFQLIGWEQEVTINNQ